MNENNSDSSDDEHITPENTPMQNTHENRTVDEVQEGEQLAEREGLEAAPRPRENSTRSNQRRASRFPKENYKIECLLGEDDTARWHNVTVGKRGGKCTGKNKSYVNVRYEDNYEGGIHLDNVPWRYQPTTNRTQQEADCDYS